MNSVSLITSLAAVAAALGVVALAFLRARAARALQQSEEALVLQKRAREQSETETRHAEERLMLHVQRSPLGVLEMNLDGHLTEWNPAAEKIFGYTRAEVLGKPVVDLLVAPRHRESVENAMAALRDGTGGARFSNDNLTKDGAPITCDWFNSTLLDPDGHIIGFSALVQDVTEQRKVAKEIENLAAFPRLNPNPIMQFASDGRLEYFNASAAEMARALGKEKVEDMLPEDTVKIVKTCIATGSNKLKRETNVGQRTISWSFFPIAAIRCVHCYASDITDRLSLEQQLRQSQKMQSVGQLAAGVAHDFNNILTVIQGHSELIRGSEKFSEMGLQSLEQITLASERAAKLTQQLLTFGRKQFMQVELLDFNEVIRRVAQMLRRVLGENISLRVNASPRLPKIEADVTMMEQIIMNMSVNARDAMPTGGSLIIATNPVLVSRAYVERNPEAREGTFVQLTISDNGTGIDAEKIPLLFEPFFTTKEVGKGTGLGLATVYGIVKQHSGWIEVESVVGKGTTFRVYLPASTKAHEAKEGKVTNAPVRGGSETVLLVEDELGVLSLARNVLRSYGYKVLEAKSGVDALRVWEQHDEIDLLLTDIVMPEGISGIDLAKKLRTEKHDLKVVYSSGYSVEVAGQDFGLREGMAFLKKPYHPQALAQMVRQTLDAKV